MSICYEYDVVPYLSDISQWINNGYSVMEICKMLNIAPEDMETAIADHIEFEEVFKVSQPKFKTDVEPYLDMIAEWVKEGLTRAEICAKLGISNQLSLSGMVMHSSELRQALAGKREQKELIQSIPLDTSKQEAYLSTAEVAKRLGISQRTVRKHIRTGVLKALSKNNQYIIPESALNNELAPKVSELLKQVMCEGDEGLRGELECLKVEIVAIRQEHTAALNKQTKLLNTYGEILKDFGSLNGEFLRDLKSLIDTAIETSKENNDNTLQIVKIVSRLFQSLDNHAEVLNMIVNILTPQTKTLGNKISDFFKPRAS